MFLRRASTQRRSIGLFFRLSLKALLRYLKYLLTYLRALLRYFFTCQLYNCTLSLASCRCDCLYNATLAANWTIVLRWHFCGLFLLFYTIFSMHAPCILLYNSILRFSKIYSRYLSECVLIFQFFVQNEFQKFYFRQATINVVFFKISVINFLSY